MLTQNRCWRATALALALAAAGCASTAELTATASHGPAVTKELQLVSAGYTGCMPEDNRITVLRAYASGGGLWRATCGRTTYLCSGIPVFFPAGGSTTGSYSCAPKRP